MTEQTQPEALRLADWIDSDFDPDEMYEFGYDQIAAELRSQHAEVQELRAATTIPTIEKGSQDWLKKDPAIAWHLIDRHADNWADVGQMMQEYIDAQKQSAVERLEARIAELEAQLAQRERPALTDEQIREALIETDGILRRRLGLPLNEPQRIGLGINPVFIIEFAHAIGRAHGIGDPT